jgi:diguanylate cyclase (GGDEF)-like protein/PAS domain S-box-containing protein
MNDKTKDDLARELSYLRKRILELEKSDADHKEIEQKIRESEKKYRTLFENASDAIYLIDPDTQRILDCNSKASKIIGYSTKQLKAMTIGELHPENEQDIVSRIFKKVAERDSLSGISGINQLKKDRTLIPVEIDAVTYKLGGKKFCLSIIRDITEHKKAEENLIYEKNKLVSILDSMEDGVYIANQHYNIEYLNPLLKKELGAIKGRKCFEYFHDRKTECPWCKNKEVFEGRSVRWEWLSPKNNKTYDMIDTPIKNPDGSISKMAISRDITELKKTEDSLRKSEKQFRDLVDNSLVGIFETNLEGDILYVNEAMCRMTGYDSPEEMMSENVIAKYKNREDRDKLIKMLYEKGSVSNFEVEALKKDGEPITFLLNAILEDNVISGMIMDITSSKLTEKSLINAKEEWEKTFDTIPDLILVIDNEHKILNANRAMAEKAGIKKEEIIGKHCYEIMHGADKIPLHCTHGKTIAEGKEHTEEIYDEKLKGFYIVSCSPIYDHDGRPFGIVEVARDITERRQMEEKLRVLAMTDELTGLFNRRGFFRLAEKHCKLANRTGNRMSLLYLDLDDMKTINDKLGHSAGDQALIDTASILKDNFRESDIIARIGGDEFAVLLTEHSGSDIEHIITTNIKNRLLNHNNQGLRNYELSLSMGVVYYDPKNPCSIDNLLTKADAFMYDAKQNHSVEQKATAAASEKDTESRIYKRFTPGDTQLAKIGSSTRVNIKDISVGGICLKTSEYLDTSKAHEIRVLSPDEDIRSEGIVVWSYLMGTKTVDDKSTPCYETGLKFINPNNRTKQSLEKYISSMNK